MEDQKLINERNELEKKIEEEIKIEENNSKKLKLEGWEEMASTHLENIMSRGSDHGSDEDFLNNV